MDLKRIHDTELAIMDEIHAFCQKHGIRYSLAYGSLIGAVRHKGFIPWDDDIDVCMLREDYDRFIALWLEQGPEGYVLQNIDTNPEYPQNLSKIRKDHTTFLQGEEEIPLDYHKGIFVDIFPGDRVAPGKAGRLWQFVNCAVELLYSRGFPSSESSGLMALGQRVLLWLPKRRRPAARRAAARRVRRWNGRGELPIVFASTIVDARLYFAPELFETLTPLPFEGREYWGFAGYDAFLRKVYGDYMQLPPEEERVLKHEPMLVDFEHNYEELGL